MHYIKIFGKCYRVTVKVGDITGNKKKQLIVVIYHSMSTLVI